MLSAGFLTGEKDFIRSKIPQEKSLADTKGQVCRATFKKSTEHAQKANHHGVSLMTRTIMACMFSWLRHQVSD